MAGTDCGAGAGTGAGGGTVSSTGTGAFDGDGGVPLLAALGKDDGAGIVFGR